MENKTKQKLYSFLITILIITYILSFKYVDEYYHHLLILIPVFVGLYFIVYVMMDISCMEKHQNDKRNESIKNIKNKDITPK